MQIGAASGRRFWPFDPRPDEIHIEDLAHALARQCRFGGHCRDFVSVAQHCVLVSHLCDPADALAGLLHDGSEAYLVDLPRPIKIHPSMLPYRRAEARVQAAVYQRFGVECDVEPADRADPGCQELVVRGNYPGDASHRLWLGMPKSVRIADEVLLATEARDQLTPDVLTTWQLRHPPLAHEFTPWDVHTAQWKFLGRFRELSSNLSRP